MCNIIINMDNRMNIDDQAEEVKAFIEEKYKEPEKYNVADSDNLFATKEKKDDWYEDEFLKDTFNKIKADAPDSPSIYLIIPELKTIKQLNNQDVPHRLSNFRKSFVFIDNKSSTEELIDEYFSKVSEDELEDILKIFSIWHIKEPPKIIEFMQLWSGRRM